MHAARSISSSGPSGAGIGVWQLSRPMSSPASRSLEALSVHGDRDRQRQIDEGQRGVGGRKQGTQVRQPGAR